MSKAKAKTTTKAPDAALIRLGETLHQQIEAAYPHWRECCRLRASHKRKLDRLRSQSGVSNDDKWVRLDAARAAFDRTAVGKKAKREREAFDAASTLAFRAARKIMWKQPQTLAGAAVFSIAALWDGDWCFAFPDDEAAVRIVHALSRAAGVRLPNGVRQAVQS